MNVRDVILQKLKKKGEVRSTEIAASSRTSRAYVHRILQELEQEGMIRQIGKANRARYVRNEPALIARALRDERSWHGILQAEQLQEDTVLRTIHTETGIFVDIAANVRDIIDYAFAEMLNNAIEHSGSPRIDVRIDRTAENILFRVSDAGVGALRNIMTMRGLPDITAAVQDLLKGKTSTMPERHSGEGIFFTSKVADLFTLISSGKKLIFDNGVEDTFVRSVQDRPGTHVLFRIGLDTSRTLTDVFRAYTSADLAFDTTRVSVQLYKTDTSLVSRSQARRLLAGLEKFKAIILDFNGVKLVGQGFADEVFRVWPSAHPGTSVDTVNADADAQFMIDRVERPEG